MKQNVVGVLMLMRMTMVIPRIEFFFIGVICCGGYNGLCCSGSFCSDCSGLRGHLCRLRFLFQLCFTFHFLVFALLVMKHLLKENVAFADGFLFRSFAII